MIGQPGRVRPTGRKLGRRSSRSDTTSGSIGEGGSNGREVQNRCRAPSGVPHRADRRCRDRQDRRAPDDARSVISAARFSERHCLRIAHLERQKRSRNNATSIGWSPPIRRRRRTFKHSEHFGLPPFSVSLSARHTGFQCIANGWEKGPGSNSAMPRGMVCIGKPAVTMRACRGYRSVVVLREQMHRR